VSNRALAAFPFFEFVFCAYLKFFKFPFKKLGEALHSYTAVSREGVVLMHIKEVSRLPPKIKAEMWRGMVAYDAAHGIDTNFKRFALIAKKEKVGKVIGVLEGFTIYSEVFVSDLWIAAQFRRQGYGRALLEDLERRFEGKGYWGIALCTSEFQAPRFYEKCGFELEFVRKDTEHPQLTKYYFSKPFKNSGEHTP
jgi:GNAT superfamily N-acetyltransferase